MAFVIYKWTFSESLSPPFADAAYLLTFEMIIGFELAWNENCSRWKAVVTVSYAFFTRAFSNAAGVENEPKLLKVDSLTRSGFYRISPSP